MSWSCRTGNARWGSQEVYAYAERSYQELKAEQLALIGGKKP